MVENLFGIIDSKFKFDMVTEKLCHFGFKFLHRDDFISSIDAEDNFCSLEPPIITRVRHNEVTDDLDEIKMLKFFFGQDLVMS